MDKIVKSDLPEGANITKAIVEGYKDGVLVAGAAYFGPAASLGQFDVGAAIGSGANTGYQFYDMGKEGNENKAFDSWSAVAAGATGSLAPGRGLWKNVGIALGGTAFTDGPDPVALTGAGVASGFSGAFGKFAPIGVDKILGDNNEPSFTYDMIGSSSFEFINGFVKDGLNNHL